MNIAVLYAGATECNIIDRIPNQFVVSDGKALIIHSLLALQVNPDIDEIGIICPNGWKRRVQVNVTKNKISKVKWIVAENHNVGSVGLHSIVDEVKARYNEDDVILIHDAEYPNISQEMIFLAIMNSYKYGAAAASVCFDEEETAVLLNEDEKIIEGTVDVSGFQSVTTPQAYKAGKLLKLEGKLSDCRSIKDICALMAKDGNIPHMFSSDSSNIRVDRNEKLKLFNTFVTMHNQSKKLVAPKKPIDMNEIKASKNDGTMVTVVCTTYNHEKYIAQALDSFLMQKTNFKFKVFVGEDCGPDHTKDIIMEYARRYPDIIIPFIREKNLGATKNTIDMTEKATSPYIAFCEGDDYWTDEYKLQKQFDYMEAHPEFTFSFARTEVVGDMGAFASFYKPNDEGKYILPDCENSYVFKQEPYTAFDFIEHFPEHTSTYFFRWNYNIVFPDWFYQGIVGDVPLRLIQMGDGKAGYIPDVVSVYRRNETGSFSKFIDKDEQFVKTRLEYVRWLFGMLEFYKEQKIQKYPRSLIENRLKQEVYNFINSGLNVLNDYEAVISMFEKYPEASNFILKYYLSCDSDRKLLEADWGWNGYQAVVRNKYFRNLLRPLSAFAVWYTKQRDKRILKRNRK